MAGQRSRRRRCGSGETAPRFRPRTGEQVQRPPLVRKYWKRRSSSASMPTYWMFSELGPSGHHGSQTLTRSVMPREFAARTSIAALRPPIHKSLVNSAAGAVLAWRRVQHCTCRRTQRSDGVVRFDLVFCFYAVDVGESPVLWFYTRATASPPDSRRRRWLVLLRHELVQRLACCQVS